MMPFIFAVVPKRQLTVKKCDLRRVARLQKNQKKPQAFSEI